MKAAALDTPWEQNEFQRWLIASVVVVAAHLFATYALLNWPKSIELSSDAPPAVIVDLAPLAVAPDSKNLDVAPGPEMMQAQPKQQQQAKAEEKTPVPNLLEKPSEVEVPAAVPEKQEQKKQETQKAQEQKKDQPKAAAPQTTAAPKLNLQKADRQAAPTAGSTVESQAAIATWRGAVVAHLNRFKRFPSGAVPGTAVVAFSIDVAGRVTGARLVSSSGNSTADADAVAMVWRANPVPAPPPSMGGNVSLSLPVRYRN